MGRTIGSLCKTCGFPKPCECTRQQPPLKAHEWWGFDRRSGMVYKCLFEPKPVGVTAWWEHETSTCGQTMRHSVIGFPEDIHLTQTAALNQAIEYTERQLEYLQAQLAEVSA